MIGLSSPSDRAEAERKAAFEYAISVLERQQPCRERKGCFGKGVGDWASL